MPINFTEIEVVSFDQYRAEIGRLEGAFLFRGQTNDWPLAHSLERRLAVWGIPLSDAPEIERLLIRDFCRKAGPEINPLIQSDTLYCLSVMQHHGAPTRLLDVTYSPYVAAKFAFDGAGVEGVIWCFQYSWLLHTTARAVGGDLVRRRNIDEHRNNESYEEMYGSLPPRAFVFSENPFLLNQRSIIQKGAFLCPGNVAVTMEENFSEIRSDDPQPGIVKLKLNLNRAETLNFAEQLRRMNVSSAVLFPGLDGFSRALGEEVFLYADLARTLTGRPDYIDPIEIAP
ncbi:FRG domain-containing protein [Phenylobacterium sp.]|uniref:FRG domain-containing protein n=1 Tax=Phenylobacterium sp. TaxID=1871053 RepID=UPI0027223C10|nr:FRG domain-containing protein [Phenylobacterium sp.]MDO8378256.1 FRG domain-containing protein [Phenylobacterium sp.]